MWWAGNCEVVADGRVIVVKREADMVDVVRMRELR